MITRKQFIKKYGGKVVPFSKLPLPYQLAMIQYMAFDGEAWEVPDEEAYPPVNVPQNQIRNGRYLKGLKSVTKYIKKNLPFWVKKYGKVKFGMLQVPMKDFCTVIQSKNNKEDDWDSFKEYHKWYKGECLWKNSNKHYSEIWPSILDSDCMDLDGKINPNNWDVLQDGWHRFHTYVEQGKKTMPLIYYP